MEPTEYIGKDVYNKRCEYGGTYEGSSLAFFSVLDSSASSGAFRFVPFASAFTVAGSGEASVAFFFFLTIPVRSFTV